MTNTQDNLKATPVHQEHLALGARMVPFGGWDMPVQYEGILTEYAQTRQAVGLFDISHMGEFFIEGDCVKSGLDRIVTMSLADIPLKSCRYGAVLNEQGGIIDDLIVFRIDREKWFIVVNGATTDKDEAHFQKHLTNQSSFKNISSDIGKLDIQGPLARDVLKPLVNDIDRLGYYTFDYFDLLGEHVLISRTGYTGELGYEIYYPWNKIKNLWKKLLKNDKVRPAGLGVRDVLRLEMGYNLYGHELNEDVTPLETGLSRFVDLDKDFIGKESLLKEKRDGIKQRIVGLTSDNRRSPRAGQTIYSQDGRKIGVVTSGTFSPSLQKGIGLGFVAVKDADKDTKILFGQQKVKYPAVITGKQFYKSGSLKH